MTARPFFSIVIPTYNRPQHLGPLLESVMEQSFSDWEVVIGDDASPRREEVRAIVDEYSARSGGRVRGLYHQSTLGYDRNLRTVMREARGRYLFVMGDDDYVAADAFRAAAAALERHPDTGVLLRAFAWFVGDRDNVVRITRYYPEECVIPAGRQAILACFRRVVCMSGLVIDRDLAVATETDRWDGSLFYQHWVIGKVLAERSALYIPDLMVHFRMGSPRSFGTAEAERHLYVPGQEPPETTYRGLYYQFAIADALEQSTGLPLGRDVRRDYANYSYPQFAFHRPRPFREYFAFYRRLGSLGLDRFASFHAWFVLVALLGPTLLGKTLDLVRRTVGHTPNITGALRAKRVSRTQLGKAGAPWNGATAVSSD